MTSGSAAAATESVQSPLTSKDTVLVYANSHYYSACKDVKSSYKDDLSANDVKWKVKKAKVDGYVELAEQVADELLKNEADLYIIALGIDELWDFKSDKQGTASPEQLETAIQRIIDQIKHADKKLILCTPHQISAGQNAAANERLQQAAAIIKKLALEAQIPVCDFYEAFAKKNAAGDPGKHNKGITTKDGLKPNDDGESLIIAAIGKSLGLSQSGPSKKATIGRDLAKGDVIMIIGPTQIGYLALPLHKSLQEHYKAEMSVSAPRALDIVWSKNFFDAEPPKLDVIGKSKPTVIMLYPGSYILGYRTFYDSLRNGEFKNKLRKNIELLQANTSAEIFLCTPLIWGEDNNQISTEGQNFQDCQIWADETRAVANECNLGVIDLHQKCLNYINTKGTSILFAGRKQTYQGQTTYTDIDYTDFAKNFTLEAFAEAINHTYRDLK